MSILNSQKRLISSLAGVILVVMVAQILSSFVVLVNCESEVSFTSGDTFEIPEINGSIRFAADGTYTSARLENITWVFENLHFPVSRSAEKLNLTVSAIGCDLVISPFFVFNYTSRWETVTWLILRYTVIGSGSQVFNLGLDPQKGQLDAVIDGKFVGRNHGWTRASDGTLTITKEAQNVTIWYYGYPDSYTSDAEFFDSHSVVIGSTISVSAVVVVAFVFRKRKQVNN